MTKLNSTTKVDLTLGNLTKTGIKDSKNFWQQVQTALRMLVRGKNLRDLNILSWLEEERGPIRKNKYGQN